jgi:hypothetical protein
MWQVRIHFNRSLMANGQKVAGRRTGVELYRESQNERNKLKPHIYFIDRNSNAVHTRYVRGSGTSDSSCLLLHAIQRCNAVRTYVVRAVATSGHTRDYCRRKQRVTFT